MSEKLVTFLRKKSNSLVEEVSFAIKNLHNTRYRFHPMEDIWESSYQIYQDGLIMLQDNNIKPILGTVQNLAKKYLKDGFQIYEPLLAFMTMRDVVNQQLIKEFNNDPVLMKECLQSNEKVYQLITVNFVEAFHYNAMSFQNYNSSYRYPVWVGDLQKSKLVE
ncbi:MAG: hypothetical protein WC955_06635 [Elusimicrobiota bacterium]